MENSIALSASDECFVAGGTPKTIGSAVFGLVETVMAIEAFMARAGPWLRAMQIVAITLLWWHWARVVRWLAGRKGLPPRAVEAALSSRNRIAVGLLFAHLVLVQRLPFVWMAGA